MHRLRRTIATLSVAFSATLLAAGPAAAQVSDQDAEFLVAAHQSNLAEIAAGTAAQQSATTDTVRELGQMFVQMHTELDAELVPVAQQLGVELPDSPNERQRAELAAVAENSGSAFDSAWIAQQTGSHQRSQANGQRELSNGENDTVVALAEASAPVIAQHLAELRQAADQYGVPTSVPGGTGGQAADSPSTVGLGLAGAGALLAAVAVGGLARSRRRA